MPDSHGPMRVLVVHNRYRSEMPSGENRVVDDDVEMLRDAGLDVRTFFRDSDDIRDFAPLQKAALTISPAYSVEAVADFRRVIGEFQPDVVHLHNPFPLISPWVVRVAKKAGIPVVQTVHNYRHSCPAGTFFRDGRVCEDCAGKATPWPSVVHGCYRDSRAQSAVMAATARIHRSTWQMVDRFLPVSDFVAGKLVGAGIPGERMVVRANPVPDPGDPKPLGSGHLFVGRLTKEKGVALLVEAWTRSRLPAEARLTVAGDGPLRPLVQAMTERHHGVRWLGAVAPTSVKSLLDDCAVVVVPSVCHEGFSLVAANAFAHGRPVAASRLGALADVVDDSVGWLSAPDVESFSTMLESTQYGVEAKAGEARQRYIDGVARNRLLPQLPDLYSSLVRQTSGTPMRSAQHEAELQPT